MKHAHYDLLNLIGYGLAKFGAPFFHAFGCKTKRDFYRIFVDNNIAENENVVKNRQDLFDPFFDNDRRGWWQKGDAYKHRKTSIDALYGELSCGDFADIVKLFLDKQSSAWKSILREDNPIVGSKFKKLQETGYAAEHHFIEHFHKIPQFESGVLEDARFFGDGYDFQIKLSGSFLLAEVKGVRDKRGSVRLTKNEYQKAQQYKADYGLVVVSNLNGTPKMTPMFNPVAKLQMTKRTIESQAQEYHTGMIDW